MLYGRRHKAHFNSTLGVIVAMWRIGELWMRCYRQGGIEAAAWIPIISCWASKGHTVVHVFTAGAFRFLHVVLLWQTDTTQIECHRIWKRTLLMQTSPFALINFTFHHHTYLITNLMCFNSYHPSSTSEGDTKIHSSSPPQPRFLPAETFWNSSLSPSS